MTIVDNVTFERSSIHTILQKRYAKEYDKCYKDFSLKDIINIIRYYQACRNEYKDSVIFAYTPPGSKIFYGYGSDVELYYSRLNQLEEGCFRIQLVKGNRFNLVKNYILTELDEFLVNYAAIKFCVPVSYIKTIIKYSKYNV